MADSSKKDVKHRATKQSKFDRIVSLFEIPRPSRRLHRTNSLPAATKRPSLTGEDEGSKVATGSLKSVGKITQIKEEGQQQNTKEKQFVSTPKPIKKKTQKHSNRKNIDKHQQQQWFEDRMEDIYRMQDRIEDVSQVIQNSDSELEITFRTVGDNNSEIENGDLLSDGGSDSVGFKRLSSDTVFSNDTIRGIFEAEVVDCEQPVEASYVSYYRFQSMRSSDDNRKDNDHTTNDVQNDNTTDNSFEESLNISEKPNISNDNDENNGTTEFDSIDWWKHKSFVQINNENQSDPKEVEATPTLGRGFIKNNRSRRTLRGNRRRTGVLQKPFSVKELTRHFEGFKDAAENGETETFRKSFIDEMDKELENMKNDGFKEDFHLSLENLRLFDYDEDSPEKGASNVLKDDDSPIFQTVIIFPKPEDEYEDVQVDNEDLFGETLFSEDLENGLYYVETYNADGKELIMCSVQIDRKSVDLTSFDHIRANETSKMLANDEKILVLMEAADTSSLNDSKSGTDSKRTTIYSTTSGESYEDEGIDASYGYSAARRETYCDDQGVVRIERIAPYPETSEEQAEYINTVNNFYCASTEPVSNEEENYYESVKLEHEIMFRVPEVKKETLQYILEEIMSTERKYISDMRKVLIEYKTFLEERCPEKVDVVFANMDHIYQKQLEFLRALEETDMNVKEVVQVFIDFEDLFRLYPRYFKNTPKANAAVKELSFLIKEKQERINDKLSLSAYLLTPLQRLGKYKLFLENIIKQLEKEQKPIGYSQMALDIVKKYMSKGNDAVAIASILHSPLHTKDYGSFITREKFTLFKPKRLELMVFLFEGVIVFASEDPKNMEQFIYYQSIKTIDLRIATFDDTTIHLTDYTKTKRRNSSKYTYVLDARNDKLKAMWKEQIEDILWKQMMKIKENTLKEYKSGNKIPTRTPRRREQRMKSTGSSIFYVE